MKRRAAMVQLGLGAASIAAAPQLLAAPPTRSYPGRPDLAQWIAAASLDEALARVADAIASGSRAGTGRRVLSGYFDAIFEAGVLEVRPTPVGGKIHHVLAVPAVHLARPDRPNDDWLAALWCVVGVKTAQELDRREGDWALRARSVPAPASARQAMSALDDAMARWDMEAADAALIGALQFFETEQLFHSLWQYAVRCFVNDGQKVVLAAQVDRQLRNSGIDPERTLRWLVRGLLYVPDATGPQTTAFERSRERVSRFPVDWQDNKERPARSVDVLRELRDASSERAQDAIVDAFRKGLGPDTVWDGLSLFAAEIALRRTPDAQPLDAFVLPLIEVNALRYAFRNSWHPHVRKLYLLQAAGWLALLRERAETRAGGLAAVEVDRLRPDKTSRSFGDALARRSPQALLAQLERSNGARGAYGGYMDEYFLPRCTGPLLYQYVFAAFREARHVHRRWRSRILASTAGYVPPPDAAETAASAKARSAMESRR